MKWLHLHMIERVSVVALCMLSASVAFADEPGLDFRVRNPAPARDAGVPRIGAELGDIALFESQLRLIAAKNAATKLDGGTTKGTLFLDTFIVGGSAFSQFPAIGAIMNQGSTHCTGTAITKRTVLTAAHCVYGFDAGAMKFVTGTDSESPQSTYEITGAKHHEGYDGANFGVNDIALLYLKNDFTQASMAYANTDIGPTLVGEGLDFVGYGYDLDEDGEKYKLGKKAHVTMTVAGKTDTTFTYGLPNKNTCNGDSGGPALQDRPGKPTWVVGITSWGSSACTATAVDMRVDAFATWIKKNSK